MSWHRPVRLFSAYDQPLRRAVGFTACGFVPIESPEVELPLLDGSGALETDDAAAVPWRLQRAASRGFLFRERGSRDPARKRSAAQGSVVGTPHARRREASRIDRNRPDRSPEARRVVGNDQRSGRRRDGGNGRASSSGCRDGDVYRVTGGRHVAPSSRAPR